MTTGIIIPTYIPLSKILAPLAVELDRCCWLIDTQSGPLRSDVTSASTRNDAIYNKYSLEVAVCRNTSASCWRPGTLPRYAQEIVIDEWTYLFAMRCDESTLSSRAKWIRPRIGRFNREFFAQLEDMADLFLMHVDGWWELYTVNSLWHKKVLRAFPPAFERTSNQVGKPPR